MPTRHSPTELRAPVSRHTPAAEPTLRARIPPLTKFWFLLSMLGLTLAASAQNTIHVPADQPTIQAGINAASNGDTVLVAPGTYYENINFKGKAITVTSSGGAATRIIDGQFVNPVVTNRR